MPFVYRGRPPAALALAMAGSMLLLCSMPTARSAEQRTACPLWLEPEAFKPDRPPSGWLAAMPQRGRLQGGGLLHGAPDESGYLKPDEGKITKKGVHETAITKWTLNLPHPFETWLYCAYGPLELYKRIPADATECTSTSTLERGAFLETVFVCK